MKTTNQHSSRQAKDPGALRPRTETLKHGIKIQALIQLLLLTPFLLLLLLTWASNA